MLTLDCQGSLWNGHTVYTEKFQHTLKSILPIKCLIGNCCTLETLLIKLLIGGNKSQCTHTFFSVSSVTIAKLTWNVFKMVNDISRPDPILLFIAYQD